MEIIKRKLSIEIKRGFANIPKLLTKQFKYKKVVKRFKSKEGSKQIKNKIIQSKDQKGRTIIIGTKVTLLLISYFNKYSLQECWHLK